MYILNKFMIMPISWDPQSLTNMYVNVSKYIDSLVRYNTTLTSTLRKSLMEIRNVIRSKTDQDKSLSKFIYQQGYWKILTVHSVVTGNRIKRQLGLMGLISNLIVSGVEEIQIKKLQTLVSELQGEGKNNFKEIGVLKHVHRKFYYQIS